MKRDSIPVGSIRVFNGVAYIKYHSKGTRKHKPWRAYERWLWERTYGPIPENNFIKHIDGNRSNMMLSNLTLTTFGQEESKRMKHSLYSCRKKSKISVGMRRAYLEGRVLLRRCIKIRECTGCSYESKDLLRCPKCNGDSFESYLQRKMQGVVTTPKTDFLYVIDN